MTRWCKKHGRALHKIIRYFDTTADMGIVNSAHPDEMHRMFVRVWWDSDYANSPDTTRSTSGWCVWLVGVHTKILLESTSKLQGATAVSTPEAETVAGANAMVRAGHPTVTLLEQVYSR